MGLVLKNIHKSYGRDSNIAQVIKGIDLEITSGTINVILGPSGSGKSTLLNIIGGIESIDEGSIDIDGQVLERLGEKELTKYRRDNLGYIFQNYNLVPNLTVKENIEVGAYLSQNPLDITELMQVLGLTDHSHKLPSQLSGGQQQRTSIGRAIIKNPNLLLCDEPTGALDYKTSKEILKLIEDVNKKYKTTIILVTHNTILKKMADRIIEIHDGQIRSDVINSHKTSAVALEW